MLLICKPFSVVSISPPASASSLPFNDVTLVILRFMLSSSDGVVDVSADVDMATSDEHNPPKVVTLAILISESGSVLLSASLVRLDASEEGEASLCTESSSSSITMGSVWLLGAMVDSAVEEEGEGGLEEAVAVVAGSALSVVSAGAGLLEGLPAFFSS